ncbi:MAG: hypothetical protein CM1200mP41_35990 [Gammaproteobacteria bacterium]|nr:MAG: hypothetical protein CM1200mP41_35990 [Gammaproteobacteria bacterium]
MFRMVDTLLGAFAQALPLRYQPPPRGAHTTHISPGDIATTKLFTYLADCSEFGGAVMTATASTALAIRSQFGQCAD